MKTPIFAAAALCLLTVATAAQAQDGSFTAPRSRTRITTQQVAPTAPRTDGAVPRAARSGNAFQMINPFAPAAYGNGQDMVRREDNDPYQNPQGIKLVTVEF
jgi:hypothetical protein